MTYDRSEYRELVEKKGQDRINGQRYSLEVMRQAAVKADLLTGDAHWDTYLSYLGAAKEVWETELQDLMVMLKAPQTVDANEIMKLKIKIAQLEFGIGVLDGVISLPKDIKKQGEDAKALLSRIDG